MTPGEKLFVRVHSITRETDAIRVCELRALAGVLPPFSCGAHIDIHLENGLTRSYSLLNRPEENDRYLIGVALDAASRGGSRYVHEHVGEGDVLKISAPQNNFPLNETARHSVLIAGGIGITPILSMVRRLTDLGASWELHYCARSRAVAAFTHELAALPRVHFFFDDENQGNYLDLAGVIGAAQIESEFYCCGPTSMLQAFEAATAALPAARVHVEYFTSRQEPDKGGGFVVECARSGKVVTVAPGQTILDALEQSGLTVQFSCRQGICGTCETGILEGIPKHRDDILTQAERDAGKTMMICCSGSRSPKLVLDI